MQLVFLPALLCSLYVSTIDIVILSSLGYMPAYNMHVNVNHHWYTVLSFEDDMTFYSNTYKNVVQHIRKITSNLLVVKGLALTKRTLNYFRSNNGYIIKSCIYSAFM